MSEGLHRAVLVNDDDLDGVVSSESGGRNADEILVVAPAVEKSQPHGVEVVGGLKIPVALFGDALVIIHILGVWMFDFGLEAKEAQASFAASNWRRS